MENITQSTSAYFINLDLLRSLRAVPESLGNADMEKRTAKQTKSLMCLQASIIPQCKINSLVPRAPLVHHLEQHQQKKFRAIPQKSQELGSVREESEIQAPTPKRAHTWSVTAIFLSLRQKNPDGKVQQFPQQVSFLANQIKQIHI